MTKSLNSIALCTVLVGLTSVASLAEHRIARSQLPAAVEKTVQAQSQGATIKGFVTDVEGGRKVYEVEMVVNGHTRDIEIAEDGSLVEIEEEVSINSLPASVQAGLHKKAGSAKIVKVESLTKKGTLVAYEAATVNGSKKGEVQVGPKGETLNHEE